MYHTIEKLTRMDVVLFILAGLFILIGLAGSFLPILPGVPLSYVGLLTLQFAASVSFSTRFLLFWGAVVVIVQLLDFYVPAWGTKRFGGSKLGVWGSVAGSLIGLFFGPWGIIFGPFVGAIAGELISGKDSSEALRAGLGSFIGFIFGTGIKIVVCLFILFYYIKEIFH